MGLITQPSQIKPRTNLSCLIFGETGIGKTTLACSAPNAVLFDYDSGVTRLHAAHMVPTVQISDWDETFIALQEIHDTMPQCQTIIIDTVGKMLEFMSAAIIKENYRLGQSDGSLTQKGYGVRKTKFSQFKEHVFSLGFNVIFVAHQREEIRGDYAVKRPDISGSSCSDLMRDIDLIGYMKAVGNARTISFDPVEEHYGKNTCGLPPEIKIPVLIDENRNIVAQNNFMSRIIATFIKNQQENINQRGRFDLVMSGFRESISEVETVEDCDKVYAIINDKNTEHIFESKIKATTELVAKAKSLGIKFDKITKKFSA